MAFAKKRTSYGAKKKTARKTTKKNKPTSIVIKL